jgi:cupin fold WbuC family metalloprotein
VKNKTTTFYEAAEGIYFAEEEIVKFGSKEVNFLKERVGSCSNKRNRICSHLTTKDKLHEMLICVMSESFISPAKHLSKTESLHVIEGEADIVFFNEDGSIDEVVELKKSASTGTFYYRMNTDIYHMLIVKSKFFIFHEVTSGPLDRSSTVFPDWAPNENNKEEVSIFLTNVNKAVTKLKNK